MATIACETADDVTVFTTEENHDHAVAALDDSMVKACEWVVKRGDERHRSFFKRVERATAELDVLWTITPYGNSEVVQAMLSFSPQCTSVTFVHASSRYVPSRHPFVDRTFASLFERFDYRLLGPVRRQATDQLSSYLAPRLLRQYDSVLALYPSIVPFLEQRVNPDAVVDWYLPEFYQPNATVEHEGLQITIPGRVSDSLRDYSLLFDLMDEINNARDRLTVCLLGRPFDDSGERIIGQCERYEKCGYDIQYYPSGEWVPAEEFTRQLARTDMIFAPDNIQGDSGGGRQNPIRGRTKTSGAIGDAVRIGRPIVMPQEFPVATEFDDFITTYKDRNDVTKFIGSWISMEEIRQKLQQQAEATARQFNLRKQARKFESLCQGD